MRIMTKKPLNAETPIESLRSWITDNEVFFKRNQGKFPDEPVDLTKWVLHINGLVDKELSLTFEDILRQPKVEVAWRKLSQLNPDVQLDPVPESLNSVNAEELIEGMDIVVDGLDRPEPRYIVNRTCNRLLTSHHLALLSR